MVFELRKAGISFERQIELPVHYKGNKLDTKLRPDFLVRDENIVELKAVESQLPIHEARMMTYLKLTGKHLGLLINFNVSGLAGGIKRIIN